jgi:hypothetical protein
MRHKSVLLGFGVFLLALGAAAAVLLVLVRHEPAFYRNAPLPPLPEARKQRSKEFTKVCFQLVNEFINRDDEWNVSFTEEQINSFFEEDFGRTAERDLPPGVSAPRVVIAPDKVRLAFRYGTRLLSTVVSIDLRVWLAAKERNVVALELQGLHAGSLPVSAQSLLEGVTEALRKHNIDVTWYRHQGNPVALLRFQADRTTPTIQLRRLELKPGLIEVGGCSLDRAALRPAADARAAAD